MAVYKLNERCRAVGCTAELLYWPEYALDRSIAQHGPNPEHVIILTHKTRSWADAIQAWLARIHPESASPETT
jgi:hypothetical protein